MAVCVSMGLLLRCSLYALHPGTRSMVALEPDIPTQLRSPALAHAAAAETSATVGVAHAHSSATSSPAPPAALSHQPVRKP